MGNGPQKEHGFTAIANEIMDAFIRAKIPREKRQIVDLILRQTYGWNRKEAQIGLDEFVSKTGLLKPAVSRSIKWLLERKVINRDVNFSPPKYSFNKHYSKWEPLTGVLIVNTAVKSINRSVNKSDSLPIIVKTKKKAKKESNGFLPIKDLSNTYSWLNIDLWLEYRAHRQDMPKKDRMTPRAEKMALNQLKKFIDQGADQSDVVERSIANGWKGLFMPDKVKSKEPDPEYDWKHGLDNA